MHFYRKYACPFKLLFKYNSTTLNPNRSGSGMTVICLVCHDQFEQKSISFMTTHRNHCKNARMIPSSDAQKDHATIDSNVVDSTVIIERPSQSIDVDEFHGTEVSTENSETDQHPTASGLLYRMEPLSDSNHLRFSIRKTNISKEKKDQHCTEHRFGENLFGTHLEKVAQTW